MIRLSGWEAVQLILEPVVDPLDDALRGGAGHHVAVWEVEKAVFLNAKSASDHFSSVWADSAKMALVMADDTSIRAIGDPRGSGGALGCRSHIRGSLPVNRGRISVLVARNGRGHRLDHFGLLCDEVFEGLRQIRNVTVASRGRGIRQRCREREACEEITSALSVEVEELAVAYDFACYVECG